MPTDFISLAGRQTVAVLFTGTVNIDETTYMFSPKVLDRANVIEFNEVVLSDYADGSSMGDGFTLEAPDVRKLFQDSEHQDMKSLSFCTKADYENYSKLLKDHKMDDPLANLYRLLKPYHLHFGYRVINEVSRFVVLASNKVKEFNLEDALDIQFLQKILPKLHGTKGKLQEPLSKIFLFCHDNKAGLNPSDENLRSAMNAKSDARYPRTAKKVARMLDELNKQGYTSFIQ